VSWTWQSSITDDARFDARTPCPATLAISSPTSRQSAARLGHPLPDVSHDVLLDAEGPRRVAAGIGECEQVLPGVVPGDAGDRLVPHVVHRDLGVVRIERRPEVLGLVPHRRQFFLGGLAFPAAAGGAHPGDVELAEVDEVPRLGQPRPRTEPVVDRQHPEVPLFRFDLRQIGGPKGVAVASPAGDPLPAVEHDRPCGVGLRACRTCGAGLRARRTPGSGLNRQAGVARPEVNRTPQVIFPLLEHDPPGLALGQLPRSLDGLFQGCQRSVRAVGGGPAGSWAYPRERGFWRQVCDTSESDVFSIATRGIVLRYGHGCQSTSGGAGERDGLATLTFKQYPDSKCRSRAQNVRWLLE